MSRKLVYRLGVVIIFFVVLKTPLSYLILGKIEKGKVIEIVFEYPGVILLPYSSYPQIQFTYKNKVYTILGEENENLLVGQEVKVVFYESNPSKAKVLTFGGLFINAIIQLPIGLLIWWALFKSYPDLFNTPSESLWFENLIKKGTKRK